MSEATVISRLPSTGDLALVGQLHRLRIALTENEYHVATILAFDPDAHVSAGHLRPGIGDPRTRLLAGDAMGPREWKVLARACCPEAGPLDDTACLALFLAERTRSAEVVLEPEIGARVRIRTRQRIGGVARA